jgi:hypothetical protein
MYSFRVVGDRMLLILEINCRKVATGICLKLVTKCQPHTPPIKLTMSHYMPWRHLGERYSSYSFSTSALDRGDGSVSRPGRALVPGKGPPVPIVQEAGWAPEATGKILLPLPGIEPTYPSHSEQK